MIPIPAKITADRWVAKEVPEQDKRPPKASEVERRPPMDPVHIPSWTERDKFSESSVANRHVPCTVVRTPTHAETRFKSAPAPKHVSVPQPAVTKTYPPAETKKSKMTGIVRDM